jgi:hypothetical protein
MSQRYAVQAGCIQLYNTTGYYLASEQTAHISPTNIKGWFEQWRYGVLCVWEWRNGVLCAVEMEIWCAVCVW